MGSLTVSSDRPFLEQTSVHPKTVTEVSRGTKPVLRRQRSQQTRGGQLHMTYMKVHPEVWRLAVEAADGEVWRIEILSETEVRVHNNSDWRKS